MTNKIEKLIKEYQSKISVCGKSIKSLTEEIREIRKNGET